VPSLLVPVTRALLDAMRARADSERTTLEPGELPQPEVIHLDPQGIVVGTWLDRDRLRIGMTVHEPELEGGRLVGGDVLLHDHDITHLLERLGYTPPSSLASWAAVTRLLPPNDVDLLRYELGLPVDARKNLVAEPITLAPEDELDRQLLADVWANPDADEPRIVYADRLQQRSDPRGELIALQLARGHAPPSERERELNRKWAPACARPLGKFLDAFQLRRGFLARVMVDDRQPIPPSLMIHPAWSTVEELDTAHQQLLLRAPLPSLRGLRIPGNAFAALSFHDRVFPRVDIVVGPELPPSRNYRALDLQNLATWQRINGSQNWPALRTLSVNACHPTGSQTPAFILQGALGRRLRHLDLTVEHAGPNELDADAVHHQLSRAEGLQRLSLLADVDDRTPLPVTLAFERDARGAYELVLQVPVIAEWAVTSLVHWIAPLGRGVERIAVHFLPAKGQLHLPAVQRDLVDRLRGLFQRLELPIEPQRPRCPWAYGAGLPPIT
jgi:uncharacterized protein (TIGR02996 family)